MLVVMLMILVILVVLLIFLLELKKERAELLPQFVEDSQLLMSLLLKKFELPNLKIGVAVDFGQLA